MISDEMRELLSAYVDGELRDADAARVEDVSKRDPELRREIEAYRTLRRKLKEWDAAEHVTAPQKGLWSQVLERSRAMDEALAAPTARWHRFVPLGIAAALLAAATAGFALAGLTAPGTPQIPAPRDMMVFEPLAPLPDLALEDSALVARGPDAEPRPLARLDDHLPSRRALDLEDAMRQAEMVRAAPPVPKREPFTEARRSAEVSVMMEGYAATAEPVEALVLLSCAPSLSPLEPVAASTGRAFDPSDGRIMRRIFGNDPAVLAPLGEVWIGTDAARRTRVVTASDWVARNTAVNVDVWADELGPKTTTPDVEVQDYILGPKARQRLLAAKPGRDAEFLGWLRSTYGAASLPTLFAQGAKDRERTVNKLVDALARDATTTGFSVLDAKGRVLGTELFRDHAVLLAFAPRLLRGYVFEAGEDGLRIAPPKTAGRGSETVRDLLAGIPARGLVVRREKLDVPLDGDPRTKRAPDGVARVTLVGAHGEAMGHGLVLDGMPIHLALFGE